MDPVAFDLTVAALDRGGTGMYARSLFAALREHLGAGVVAVQCPGTRPQAAQRTVRDRMHTLARDLWWFPVGLSRAAHRARLLHVPIPFAPISPATPAVLTVHDLAIVRFPEKFRRWHGAYARRTLPSALRKAASIIAVSEASRQDVIDAFGISPNRVHVVHNGVDARFVPANAPRIDAIRSRYDLPANFVLTVGYVEPRKNLDRLCQAIRLLRDRGARDINLVHAGPDGWLAGSLPERSRSWGLEGAVRFLGFVPEADLPALYSAARVTAYPSLFEGFGLPVLEAMACGSPVVTSATSSLREVAGDAALLIEPTSVESIADGIHRLWYDDTQREQYRARGRARASQFTWARSAQATIRVYESTLGVTLT